MAREHPVPKASSSQKQVQMFDGESDDDVDEGPSKAATAKKRSSEKNISKLFVKEDKPIKFYIVDRDVEWDIVADVEDRIKGCGGEVVDKRPDEGYTLVDPRTESGEFEVASYSTKTGRVVSFLFVEESIERGKLVPLIELGLFIREGIPVKFHLHESLPEDEVENLRYDILLRGGNPDAEISEARVVIHSKAFRDKAILHNQWHSIELFETSDWLESCMAIKRFIITGAGGRRTAPQAPRPIPAAPPGRRPGAGRTEFNEQDDRCLIAWMAYKFGNNQAGRQGNRSYKDIVQDPDQLWWTSRHTWQSWRERYKNKKAHLDPLIAQAANEREKNKPPRRERKYRLPIFPDSEEDDSVEQEDVAQEPEPAPVKARPKRVKRKAQDADDMDEQPDPEPAKPIRKAVKRVKAGTQPKDAPTIKTSASQKAREASRQRTPSPPAPEPSRPVSSSELGSPPPRVESLREESPVTRPGDDREPDGSQSPTQFQNAILDQAVLGGAQGTMARYNAELAQVAANEIEDGDDPDVDVVGITQAETVPSIHIGRSQSEVDESRTGSTRESYQGDFEETGETVLDTPEQRLSALAHTFGAVYSRVIAYYTLAMKEGKGEAAAYEFTEQQLRDDARLEKGKGRAGG